MISGGGWLVSGSDAGSGAGQGSRGVSLVLALLLALDVTIAIVAFFFPGLWFTVFHGVPVADPIGLLRRMGANWTAFAILQAIALVRWKREPRWLFMVAGARLGDALTDWACLAFASSTTVAAKVLFGAAGPTNVLAAIFLIRAAGLWTKKNRSGSPERQA